MLPESVVYLDIEHQLGLLVSLCWRDAGCGRASGVSPSGAKACETRPTRLPV